MINGTAPLSLAEVAKPLIESDGFETEEDILRAGYVTGGELFWVFADGSLYVAGGASEGTTSKLSDLAPRERFDLFLESLDYSDRKDSGGVPAAFGYSKEFVEKAYALGSRRVKEICARLLP
jgi:hypothetical protein